MCIVNIMYCRIVAMGNLKDDEVDDDDNLRVDDDDDGDVDVCN